MPHTVKLLSALFIVGCASINPKTEPYSNSPECASQVAVRTQDPTLGVDSLPRPLGIFSPPRLVEERKEAEISLVVSERGTVVPGSVQISGSVVMELRLWTEGRAEKMKFRPARVGDCWVPSSYQFTVRYASPPRS